MKSARVCDRALRNRVGTMLRRVGAVFFLAYLSAAGVPAAAPALPEILVGPDNSVPACVTPGRLMAFLKTRNDELHPRYDGIATQYMRFGELHGIRWDFAFYQMIVETGALSYWRGSRHGDVKPEQLNFAGLGATGSGERGESFKDMETGVRAHIEHIMLYAGRPVDNPAAERTRKVRQWGLLTTWQKGFNRPITFADLATRWAGNRSYASMLQTVAEQFQQSVCARPDPQPALVQEARRLIAGDTAANKAADAPAPTPGQELAQRAMAQAKAEGTATRSALGASSLPPASEPAAPSVPYKVANPPPSPDGQLPTPPTEAGNDAKTVVTPKSGGSGEAMHAVYAGLAAAAKAKALPEAKPLPETKALPQAKAPPETTAQPQPKATAQPQTMAAAPVAANQKCRVWTASYGGQKSIIIRSVTDQVVNFTVLDVNAGSESREAEAFIAAYAKNGRITGEYANQAQALDKAFELCPEG
jgi:Mannosyl-glycoprotein endo-beta-N-acetylglucosaminidase